METDYDNAKGFKTWGVVYNGSDSDTVCIAREDGCACRSIGGQGYRRRASGLVRGRLLDIGLRSKL